MPTRMACLWLLFCAAVLCLAGISCDEDSDTDEEATDDDSVDDDGSPSDDDDDASPAGDDDVDDGTLRFPDDFLFGTATSGFQIEMGCPTLPADQCDDLNSDWYQFVTSPETVDDPLAFVQGDDPAALGPGHWELFEADFDLAAQELGNNSLRLGLEWSRIFPTSTAGIAGYEKLLAVADQEALAHYRQVFAALRARGLQPLVTLNHYTLPLWIHDGVGCHVDFRNCSPRGWLDRATIVAEIAKYAGFVAREFGDEVDLWTTLNEPFAVLLPGFLLPSPERSNPPAVFMRISDLKEAMAAMIEAHARMVDAIRANDTIDADGDGEPNEVGIVYAMSPAAPLDPNNELDQQAADNIFYLWNLAFLNAVALGEFDCDLDGVSEYRPDLDGRLDFLGLNYYARMTVEGLPVSLFPWATPLMTFNPLTMRIDEVYPRGIYEITSFIQEAYDVPVYVTENNGRSDPDDCVASEIRYLVEHLSWLWYAIEQGVDVRGYFYWSLLDNYEWNQGMRDYGLFAVGIHDAAKPRTPRKSVAIYQSINEAHGVPPELMTEYPVDFTSAGD